MLGVLLSQVLGISRMMYAMGRGGDLPNFLCQTNAHDVPALAVLITGSLTVAVAWFGKLEVVAAAASFTILLYYSITNLSALQLPAVDRRFPRWVAWMGLGFCLMMGASLSPAVIVSGVALLAVGLLGRAAARLAVHSKEA